MKRESFIHCLFGLCSGMGFSGRFSMLSATKHRVSSRALSIFSCFEGRRLFNVLLGEDLRDRDICAKSENLFSTSGFTMELQLGVNINLQDSGEKAEKALEDSGCLFSSYVAYIESARAAVSSWCLQTSHYRNYKIQPLNTSQNPPIYAPA